MALIVFEQVNGKPVAVNPALVQMVEATLPGGVHNDEAICTIQLSGLHGFATPGALQGQMNINIVGSVQVKGTLAEVLTRLDGMPTWIRRDEPELAKA